MTPLLASRRGLADRFNLATGFSRRDSPWRTRCRTRRRGNRRKQTSRRSRSSTSTSRRFGTSRTFWTAMNESRSRPVPLDSVHTSSSGRCLTPSARSSSAPRARALSAGELLVLLGERAAKDPNSFVGACYRRGVPYFVPALNDSSIGIALTKHYRDRRKAGKPMVHIHVIKDNYEITQIKVKSPRTGVFYVGGGAPQN